MDFEIDLPVGGPGAEDDKDDSENDVQDEYEADDFATQ